MTTKTVFIYFPIIAFCLAYSIMRIKELEPLDLTWLWPFSWIGIYLFAMFVSNTTWSGMKIHMAHWWEATGWVWAIGLPVAGLIVYFSARAMDTDGDRNLKKAPKKTVRVHR